MLYFLIFFIATWILYDTASKDGKISNRSLMLILTLLALIVGFGDMLGGYDRYGYSDLFDKCADQLRAGKDMFSPENPIMGYASEMSYVYWNMLVSHITENRYIFILLTTFFIYVMVYLSFKEYIEKYPFAILMFLSLFFFFTFTYLRQALATCFCWYAYRFVIRRKFINFAIFAFIAYKFHNSAIVFFPFYFFPRKKYPMQIVVTAMTILLLIGATGWPSGLYTVYGDATGADERSAQYEQFSHSFRIEYVLEVIVFLFFIFKKYDKIPNDPKYIVLLNAALCFCAFLLFFVTSSAAGRQSWYYMMGVIATLTYLATLNDKAPIRNELYLVLLLLFIRFVTSWGILVSPYKTFLTDGIRDDDPLPEQFEYDEKYEKDKFYRKAIDIL